MAKRRSILIYPKEIDTVREALAARCDQCSAVRIMTKTDKDCENGKGCRFADLCVSLATREAEASAITIAELR